MFSLICLTTLLLCVSMTWALNQTDDAVTWSNDTHIVTSSPHIALRGLNSIVANWNWQTRNVTALYVGSVRGEALYRFDLATRTLSKLRNVEGGVGALSWAGSAVNQQTLGDDSNELYYGSPGTGRVFALSMAESGEQKTRELTAGTQLVRGVRSLPVTRSNDHLHAVTCDGDDTLWQYDSSPLRKSFCKVASGYGCLGQTAFHGDNTLFGVSVARREIVRVWSGKAVKIGDLPADTEPVGVALDSRNRLYIGVNRVTANQRQAEIHRLDMKSGNTTLVAAIGGAHMTAFTVSRDDRVFVVDAAHNAVHEVEFRAFRHDELRLINAGHLASGAAHAGGAGAKNSYGHMAWRTHMLFGAETTAVGGGIAAFSTHDGTELLLLADTFQLKSVTARKFVDSWPLPAAGASATRSGSLRATNVHVQARNVDDGARPVVVSSWEDGEVAELTSFAPHRGDLELARLDASFETPYGVARTRYGSVLAADFTAGVVRQLDGFVAARDLDGPVGLAVGDDNGKLLYVSEWRAGRLVELNVDAGTKRTLLSGLSRPEGVAVNPLNGHVVVVETAGDARLLSIDPATPEQPIVLAANLTRGVVNTALGDAHPYLMTGVAFGDAVGSDEPCALRRVSLYVSFDDGHVARYDGEQTLADPNGKPLDVGVVLPRREERDGRQVAVVNLFHPALPAHIAVPAGTWLRFVAHRIDAVHRGAHAPAGARWLSSADIPNFSATMLYPADANNKPGRRAAVPRGAAHYEILLADVGRYTYTDMLHQSIGKLTVYDAAYDDKDSRKYMPDATGAPTPAPTDAPVCRTKDNIDCPPGTVLDGEQDANGCYVSIRCIPAGYSYLKYPTSLPDGSPGNFHGGNPPYVPRTWTVTDPIQRPSWPGNHYQWKQWREWWQTARPGKADPSQYWYAPQHRPIMKIDPDDQLFDAC